MRGVLLNLIRSVNRKLFNVKWYDLRQPKPVSSVFGLDRGLPVDRYYIEHFLEVHKHHIKGTVLEIGDDYYSKKYGTGIEKQEILHFASDNPSSTIIGDLTDQRTLVRETADCIICTQTLNFIYDVQGAVRGIHYMLKNSGIALVTVAGISQISRYDMDRWGDYWRFTELSLRKMFSDVFNPENLHIHCYGNVLSSIAFLEGISSDELSQHELMAEDGDYQVLIALMAVKE